MRTAVAQTRIVAQRFAVGGFDAFLGIQISGQRRGIGFFSARPETAGQCVERAEHFRRIHRVARAFIRQRHAVMQRIQQPDQHE